MNRGRTKSLRREVRRLVWNAAVPVGAKFMDKARRRVYLLHRHLSAIERQKVFLEMYPVMAGVQSRPSKRSRLRLW